MNVIKTLKTPSDLVDAPEDTKVREVLLAFPEARAVFDAWGIDYCCAGDRKLRAASSEKGMDLSALADWIQETIADPRGADVRDWTEATVTELTQHIASTHHVFMKRELPRIENLLEKVLAVHGERHGTTLRELLATYRGFKMEIEGHLIKEEEILFPTVAAIDAFLRGHAQRPLLLCGSVEEPIRQMELEHHDAGQALAKMRSTASDYRAPRDVCASFEALYQALPGMERDLHEHIHLENNILFPAAVGLERQLAGL